MKIRSWKKAYFLIKSKIRSASKYAVMKNSSAIAGVHVDPMKQFEHKK